MFKVVWVAVLVGCQLLAGCASARADATAAGSEAVAHRRVLMLGQLWLPIPTTSEFWIDEGPMLTTSDGMVAYRAITRRDMAHIGSEKSPYAFMHSAFNSPDSETELVFVDGLAPLPEAGREVANGLEFYRFSNASQEKLYVLSPALDFVVEISLSAESDMKAQQIYQQARLN